MGYFHLSSFFNLNALFLKCLQTDLHPLIVLGEFNIETLIHWSRLSILFQLILFLYL